MTDTNVLDDLGKAPATPVVEDTPALPNFADQLSQIKNGDGAQKYSDVPSALQALGQSQSHISTIETENKTLRDALSAKDVELEKLGSVEDTVAKLLRTNDPQPATTAPVENVLNDEAVNKLLDARLDLRDQQKVETDNYGAVDKILSDKFGEKAGEQITSVISSLGMSVDGFKELSRKSPQAALALFNQSTQAGAQPTSSSINIQPNKNQTPTLEKPTKSLLQGATSQEQKAFMAKIKADVYAKHGVET